MMEIANPIYDVVFMYLMGDIEVAKLIVSTIVKEEVVSLDFLPQDETIQHEAKSINICHLDFLAKIKTKDGFIQKLIEVQKAKSQSDIIHFKRLFEAKNRAKQSRILYKSSIYFLNDRLKHNKSPIFEVKESFSDMVTGKHIDIKNEFLESLMQDYFVIQIPLLNEDHKTEIEKLLSIFNQNRQGNSIHILEIDEDDYPLKFRAVIRRLQKAALEKEIRVSMDIEDKKIVES